DQWNRFQAIPNLLYCDGNEWGLYRSGEAVRPVVRLSGDVAAEGARAVTEEDAQALLGVLTDFLSWEPIIPTKAKGIVDLRAFAGMLAPLCGLLRDDVTDALKDPQSPLVQLAGNWRQLLFPDTADEQFADAYAQTVTFALLLAKSEGADLHPPIRDPRGQALFNAENALAAEHSLLSRALQVLTDPNAQAEISASLDLLIRVIGKVSSAALKSPKDAWLLRYQDSLPFAAPPDPWLFFYEDFLAAYDQRLRKDAGAYYTPVEVVLAQVRLIDDLLTNRLGKVLGFADRGVVTLDPAVGTGTYLLAVIDHALARVHAEEGKGALPGQATALARNIYGFEMLVGPFAVSELRVTKTLQDWGAKLPTSGTNVYLTDTLESPHATPPQMGLWYKEIAEQHKRALQVKATVPVIVCLGNPPYDRHEAADESNKARTGGWVRWGDDGQGTGAIFKAFLDPVVQAGHGVHAKWLYNLYVYFWRWALWKVFEHKTAAGPGVVSFISASSYLFSDAFCGMRKHMRRLCDEIWILDLGGEGRGGRKDENVFAIQTPVAIAVAVRYGKAETDVPAKVHYARIEGTRAEKLKALKAIADFASLQWGNCPDEWSAAFLPSGKGGYFAWPIVRDLFPWQHSGSQLFRSWPIAPDAKTLEARWRALLKASNRATAFRESRDRKVDKTYLPLLSSHRRAKPIDTLPARESCPEIVRYGFRSFDRQYVLADTRVGDVMKPVLWEVAGNPAMGAQVFITSQLWQVLGNGPALTATVLVPDFHHFKGSYGGKDVIALYRNAQGKEANILPGLLDVLAKAYGRKVTPEDFLAYVYGVLAQPAFTDRFADELATRELRVPLTKDAALFAKVRDVGVRLLWLHTYGERFVPKGKQKGHIPRGAARCTQAVPGDAANYPEKYGYNEVTRTLRVGAGEFSPVEPEVYAFEVSGFKVVQSWLGYRMKKPKGKKSSPLDAINCEKWPSEFTTELLELLWVLEATLAEYPAQAKLLAAVVRGPCFKADELPPVPAATRKPPARSDTKRLFDETEDEAE
ncbi:MAG: N-6 DNA methylase, partial [Chloroflexi bacterium]|nr:N-6 DNA methylase [Chloroflexota bacterium]